MEIELEGFQLAAGAERLQKIPLFKYLSFDETSALATLSRVEKRPAGTVLVEQNALGSALHLVVEGTVRVERDPDGDGPRGYELLGRLGPGSFFGEMSLVDDMLTSARVIADTDVELITIDRAPFEKLIASNDRLAAKVYRSFCWQLSGRLRRMNALLAGKAELGSHT